MDGIVTELFTFNHRTSINRTSISYFLRRTAGIIALSGLFVLFISSYMETRVTPKKEPSFG